MVSGKSPVTHQNGDAKLPTCFNRIIANTIEQSFVFFGIYFYWLQNKFSSNIKYNKE
jgi:hypothetical protein